ncbi:hypothetical protein ACQP1G_20690 [Nocardia sp. CA-107356]|uniref:hypothetical protein n=1 Tax=Nocardia sp. CA-107356 TaxID=3239972 RepID=UPI003D8B6A9C
MNIAIETLRCNVSGAVWLGRTVRTDARDSTAFQQTQGAIMGNNTTAEHALTADEIRALRSADHLVFSTHDGRTEVRAIVDECHSSTGFEQRRDIPCDVSVLDYERPGITCAEVSAFHMRHYAKTDHIATVTRHLAKGDRLMLLWRRNNPDDPRYLSSAPASAIDPSGGSDSPARLHT